MLTFKFSRLVVEISNDVAKNLTFEQQSSAVRHVNDDGADFSMGSEGQNGQMFMKYEFFDSDIHKSFLF